MKKREKSQANYSLILTDQAGPRTFIRQCNRHCKTSFHQRTVLMSSLLSEYLCQTLAHNSGRYTHGSSLWICGDEDDSGRTPPCITVSQPHVVVCIWLDVSIPMLMTFLRNSGLKFQTHLFGTCLGSNTIQHFLHTLHMAPCFTIKICFLLQLCSKVGYTSRQNSGVQDSENAFCYFFLFLCTCLSFPRDF